MSAPRPKLRQAIGSLGFFSLAFGSMIGVGWITSLGDWLTNAGPGGAVIAFVLGGLMMGIIGLCYAEITPMMPLTGGEVAYTWKSHGTRAAFVIGWFLAFGYLAVSAFEAVSVGTVISYLFPDVDCWPLYDLAGKTVYGGHILIAVGFTSVITTINYRGVEIASRVQVVLTLILAASALAFVAAGLSVGSLSNLQPAFTDKPAMDRLGGMLAVLVTVPFWYVGFDTIPQAAEERTQGFPVARLGHCVILAIVGSTIFYAAVILAAGFAAPWPQIAAKNLPTAAAFESAFQSTIWRNLVLAVGLIGLVTSWNGFFLASTRVLFALGRGRIIMPGLAKTHETYGTPTIAVLFVGAVTVFSAFLGRGARIAFIDFGSFCIAVAFLGVALSVIRLRRTHPDMHRPYRIPGGLIVPRAAVVLSLVLLAAMLWPGSPARLTWPLSWALLGGVAIAGRLFWVSSRAIREQLSESERARLIEDDC